MSKFSKPKPAAEPDQEGVRFTMTLAGNMARRIDRARKSAGGMTRLSYIRMAIAERLARDGV